MELDPRRLRFLLAVARYGGVLAAADELQVTASAVSQQIGRLERESGRALLKRTPTGSVLTPAGLALAEAAEDVERALAVARTRLEQDAGGVTGTVRIGGFPSFLATSSSPALSDWRTRTRGCRSRRSRPRRPSCSAALRAGTLDAFVVELDAGRRHDAPRGTSDTPLLDEPWKLVVPSGALLSTEVVDLSRLVLPWLGVDPTAAGAKAIRRAQRLLGGEQLERPHLLQLPERPGPGRRGRGRDPGAVPGARGARHRGRRRARHPRARHAPRRPAPPTLRRGGSPSSTPPSA